MIVDFEVESGTTKGTDYPQTRAYVRKNSCPVDEHGE